jgi:class 3 adenylate cyclase
LWVEGLPSGVVTFLLTDVEGSTGLWERDEAGMDAELARHDSIVRAAIAAHGGHVFSTAGDSFAAAFRTPMEGLSAAVASQRALGEIGLRVRMAVHTGEAHERMVIISADCEPGCSFDGCRAWRPGGGVQRGGRTAPRSGRVP